MNEISSLKPSIEALSKEQNMLHDNRSSLMEQISTCEQAIKRRGVEIKKLVDEQCNQLLGHLEKVKIERVKKMQTRKDEIEAQLLMLSSAQTYVEELVEKGSACAISQSAKDLLARANNCTLIKSSSARAD